MASVIICIHGLGNKPPNDLLKKWWLAALKEGLHRDFGRVELPRFEMVYWADILHDKPLNPDEKDTASKYYLDEVYTKSLNRRAEETSSTHLAINDFLGHQLQRILLNDDMSLNYSYITDSIIKKYFADLEAYYDEAIVEGVTENAKVAIRQRLLQKLKKYRNFDIMLIAHSMGSIVAFDVLKFLSPNIKIHTLITIGSPLGLPIVLSQIANEFKTRNNGTFQFKSPSNITNAWFNFSDINDKVAFKYKLNDVFKPNQHEVQPIDFLVYNDYQMNGIANPHKSYGYLRTPQFSRVLKSFIAAEKLSIFQRMLRIISKLFKKN